MFLQTEPKAAIAALRGMAERVDHTEILVKIDIPTIIICGEQDKITNLQTAKLLHKQIKNSQFHTIKNAGHYSNLEQPEQFNLVLRNFIKEVGF
jgi:pimeloyl-ACP methyl ester carboxylesterase